MNYMKFIIYCFPLFFFTVSSTSSQTLFAVDKYDNLLSRKCQTLDRDTCPIHPQRVLLTQNRFAVCHNSIIGGIVSYPSVQVGQMRIDAHCRRDATDGATGYPAFSPPRVPLCDVTQGA
jgi:hypothetical protein